MKRKIVFCVLLVLLLTPWPVAYARNDSANESPGTIVTTAGPEAQPIWILNGQATVTVAPGDLFYIDIINSDDSEFILFITNTDGLVQQYSDMTLNMGIYAENNEDGFIKIKPDEYSTYDDMNLTMTKRYTCFTLPGNGSYKVSIEKGCLQCDGASNENGDIEPEFYLTRRQ